MTLESKENYPRHTKIVQNSLGFMPEVKPLHKPRGDLVLCAQNVGVGARGARGGRASWGIIVSNLGSDCFLALNKIFGYKKEKKKMFDVLS